MNNKELENKIPWWRDGVIIFVKVSTYIAVPIIVASYSGKMLDNKYKTEPLLFLILITVAFFITIFLIWKELKIYKKRIDLIEKTKEKKG